MGTSARYMAKRDEYDFGGFDEPVKKGKAAPAAPVVIEAPPAAKAERPIKGEKKAKPVKEKIEKPVKEKKEKPVKEKKETKKEKAARESAAAAAAEEALAKELLAKEPAKKNKGKKPDAPSS